MSDFKDPAATLLTFDLNGTLVDWEASARAYLAELLQRKGAEVDPGYFYDCWYYRHHLPAVAAPYRPYGEFLQASLQAALRVFCIDVAPDDGAEFGEVMSQPEPFPEASEVLRQLSGRYDLGVISNNAKEIIAAPLARLGVPFAHVVTAEDAEAYKPDARPFEMMLNNAGAAPSEVIHIAQSQWADLPRSIAMGMRTIWINRHGQTLHSGCPVPQAELSDLTGLPGLLLD